MPTHVDEAIMIAWELEFPQEKESNANGNNHSSLKQWTPHNGVENHQFSVTNRNSLKCFYL